MSKLPLQDPHPQRGSLFCVFKRLIGMMPAGKIVGLICLSENSLKQRICAAELIL